jgi:hypothetical protein
MPKKALITQASLKAAVYIRYSKYKGYLKTKPINYYPANSVN